MHVSHPSQSCSTTAPPAEVLRSGEKVMGNADGYLPPGQLIPGRV